MAEENIWGVVGTETEEVKAQAEIQERGLPDTDHRAKVKGLRRYVTKAGDGIVALDFAVASSALDGREVREFTGFEGDISYFFPRDNPDQRRKNVDRLMKDLKTINGGKLPAGNFNSDFEKWGAAIMGRGFLFNQQTSTQVDKRGNPYVNRYINKATEITAEDNKWLAQRSKASDASPTGGATASDASPTAPQGLKDEDIPF